MKNINRVQCVDGTVHESQKAALTHLNTIFGKKIRALTTEMLNDMSNGNAPKYSIIGSFIDRNLLKFNDLMLLKEDMKMQPNDADDFGGDQS